MKLNKSRTVRLVLLLALTVMTMSCSAVSRVQETSRPSLFEYLNSRIGGRSVIFLKGKKMDFFVAKEVDLIRISPIHKIRIPNLVIGYVQYIVTENAVYSRGAICVYAERGIIWSFHCDMVIKPREEIKPEEINKVLQNMKESKEGVIEPEPVKEKGVLRC